MKRDRKQERLNHKKLIQVQGKGFGYVICKEVKGASSTGVNGKNKIFIQND